MSRIRQALTHLATHARLPWIAGLVAFLLALPTAFTTFFGDDLLHEYLLRGNVFPGSARGKWDLYRFADGGAGIRESISQGIFPWWSNPELKLSFFRPLASLWRAADHSIWGDRSLPAHLETCLVYAAVVVVVALFFRRFVGGAAAGLGALLFAVDDAHSLPITWTANRYAVLSALFGFASLHAHIRAREDRATPFAAPVLFGLALASGETALGILGYLVAYAWFADPGGRKASLGKLLPFSIPLVLWAIPYRALHYGAHGSSFYIDPVDAPLRFLRALPVRLPILALGQIFGPPAEVWGMGPLNPVRVAIGAAIVAALLYRVVFRAAAQHRATVMLAVGSLLAAIPVCSVQPDDRVLLVPGLGIAGVLGIALESHWRALAEGRARIGPRAVFAVLAFVHLVVAPVLLPLRGRNMAAIFESVTRRGDESLPADPAIEGKTIVVLAAPDALLTSIAFLRRRLRDVPTPRRAHLLTSQVAGSATVERTGPRTIEIRNPDGESSGPLDAVFRERPLAAGDATQTEIMRAEVVSLAANGRPGLVRFTFSEPIDSIRWVVWQGRGFVEVPTPAMGEPRSYVSTDLLTFLQK